LVVPAPPPTFLREFEFTDQDFAKIRRLLYEHSGIALSQHKKDMVYSRLARRLRVQGLRSFREYLEFLDIHEAEEWQFFINALTTNLTAFFRENHHFAILGELVRGQTQRPLRLWCCGSATGEEAYSMAMCVADVFGTLRPPVEILATDIDTQVLSTAREGIYPLDRLDKLPPETVKRYFLKGQGQHAGHAKARDELRSLISFRALNLLAPRWPMTKRFDAIFCRNVLIYFDKDTQHRILQRFHALLKAHGLLFLGHSESLYNSEGLFRLRGQTVYIPVRIHSEEP
jgi:chemotaxis protein methyltransferase CheR